jgi:hypothetical protein
MREADPEEERAGNGCSARGVEDLTEVGAAGGRLGGGKRARRCYEGAEQCRGEDEDLAANSVARWHRLHGLLPLSGLLTVQLVPVLAHKGT